MLLCWICAEPICKSLWPFQTVNIKGQRYCLTRLGFGLNVAPIFMQSIIIMVMVLDETIQGATSSYIDDIFVNKSACTAALVRDHLLQFGLACKDPERLRDGTRVLGLRVMKKHGKLQWSRGGELPMLPDILTRRSIFSLCGKLTGHLPARIQFLLMESCGISDISAHGTDQSLQKTTAVIVHPKVTRVRYYCKAQSQVSLLQN